MRSSVVARSMYAASVTIYASSLGMQPAAAQTFEDLKQSRSPLVLKAQGSFYIGGNTVAMSQTEAGGYGVFAGGNVTVGQMYVQYMVPAVNRLRVPVVMVHGGTLSGKGYETQPDGRMGWAEYFVRKNFPVYVPDQVSRGRSGFNHVAFNKVREGSAPPSSQPLITRLSDEAAWSLFRFGPAFGVPYRDEKFPTHAVKEFGKQGIPDINAGLTPSDATPRGLSELAKKVRGAVIIGHSQSGLFPLQTALIAAKWTKGLVVMEPGSCDGFTDDQIKELAKVPILTVFGDHLDTPGSVVNWVGAYNSCKAFVKRINAARGEATMLYPPELGIRGNSHMLMNDKNSDQIADLIIKWIDKKVEKRH